MFYLKCFSSTSIGIIALLLGILFSGCFNDSKDRIKEKKQLVDQAVDNMDLRCYSEPSNPLYIKGFVGEDEFCYYDGIEGFSNWSAMGSRFVTSDPSSDGNVVDIPKSFYTISLDPNREVDFPEGFMEFRFFLPTQNSVEQEFFDLIRIGAIPFTNDDFNIPGVSIDFNVLLRTNPHSNGHSLINFTSAMGPQPNSFCEITAFSSERFEDRYEGIIELNYNVILYHGSANGYEGNWRKAIGELKLPWTLYL